MKKEFNKVITLPKKCQNEMTLIMEDSTKQLKPWWKVLPIGHTEHRIGDARTVENNIIWLW